MFLPKSLGIGSYAVAVSEKQGPLTKYLDAFKRNTSLNLTSINMAGKQDPNVGRRKSNPRKRFKGPMPSAETVVSCQNVFGLTTPKQPHAHLPSSTPSSFNKQTAADFGNDFSCGGALVPSEVSVPLARSVCDAVRHLHPGSGCFDGAFSFLADLLNDVAALVGLAGPANHVHVDRGLQDCTFPSHVSASPPLVIPVTSNTTITTSWGYKNSHSHTECTYDSFLAFHVSDTLTKPMMVSWGSYSATPSPNVPRTASWGSKSAKFSPSVPRTASWGSK